MISANPNSAINIKGRRHREQEVLQARREFFLSIRPGDEIEIITPSSRRKQEGMIQAMVLQPTPRLITFTFAAPRGRMAKDSITVNQYMIGEYEIKLLKRGAKEMVNKKTPRPTKDALLTAIADGCTRSSHLMKAFNVGYATMKEWLKEYGIKLPGKVKNEVEVVKEAETRVDETTQSTAIAGVVVEEEPVNEAESERVEVVVSNIERDEFTWYGRISTCESTIKFSGDGRRIRISPLAAAMLSLQKGDKIKIGLADCRMAIKKDSEGYQVNAETGGNGLSVSAQPLVRKLKDAGWQVPAKHMARAVNGMLLVEMPRN